MDHENLMGAGSSESLPSYNSVSFTENNGSQLRISDAENRILGYWVRMDEVDGEADPAYLGENAAFPAHTNKVQRYQVLASPDVWV